MFTALILVTALYSHVSGIITAFLTCFNNTSETEPSKFCFQLAFGKEQMLQPLFTD